MSKHRNPARKLHKKVGRRGIIALMVLGGLVLLGTTAMVTGTQVEQHNSFCASCHTQDESRFYQQSLAPAMDLASFHESKGASLCIDCHSGPGIMGRIDGLMAGASDMISYVSGHYPQPAIQEDPIGDGNCLKCHATVTQTRDMNNHYHALLSQWQAMAPASAASCVSCHNGHKANGDAQIGFLNKNDTLAICQQCHEGTGVQ
jgi:predicted CXXCH cytochrome family protein